MTGFEPVTSSLPRKCSTPELHWHFERKTRLKLATLSLEGWCSINWATSAFWWGKMDSNHRRHTPADLQSAPFGHSGIRPASHFWLFCASCRIRTNDPEITNHVLWPTELKRHHFKPNRPRGTIKRVQRYVNFFYLPNIFTFIFKFFRFKSF